MPDDNSSLSPPEKKWLTILQQGIAALNLTLDAAVSMRLLHYANLLLKWNRTYNLTAVHGLQEILTRHILDSLAVVPWVRGPRILDVGTGAGLPGIPLALALPDYQFVLLDSVGKKIHFLVQANMELKLSNVQIVQARMEAFSSPSCFNTIISRALSTLNEMITRTKHLCCDDGQWLAMKGKYPAEELAVVAAGNPDLQAASHALNIPGLTAQRHAICLQRAPHD